MADSPAKKRRGPKPYLTTSAKKKRRSELDKKRSKTRVYIGAEIERWEALKESKLIKFDHELAKLLLDSYEENGNQGTISVTLPTTSTPAAGGVLVEGSSGDERGISVPELSGIEAMYSSESEYQQMKPGPSGEQRRHRRSQRLIKKTQEKEKRNKTSSFMNPFDLSINVSEVEDVEQNSDDEDYEVSCNITLRPNKFDELEDVAFGDAEFGNGVDDDNDEERESDEDIDFGPGVIRVLNQGEGNRITDDECFIVYLKPLLTLAKKFESSCKVQGCEKTVEVKQHVVGSAIYLKWICSSEHCIYQWCSQPVMYRGLHAGDFMSAAAILTSGNNYTKVAHLASVLKMKFVSAQVYNRIQRVYLVPTIEDYWKEQNDIILNEFKDKDVVILGDGRMDSPGHSAQYCSYTAMENTSKKILNVVTLDKRETERKSVIMEKVGFQKTLEELSAKGIKVTEVVTDAHAQIGAIMKRDHQDKKHSHDIWHAAKNLGKKILAIAQKSQCKSLKNWSQDIANHFWHVCQNANTYEEFIGMWCGVLHHVVDEHTWVLPYSDEGDVCCSHGPLSEEQTQESKWLKKGSPAHEALRGIILDKRFLNKVPYFLNFRSTAELENYHQLILMYAAKRFSYTPPVYKARTLLAALDYNAHCDREIMKNKDGSTRYHRTYNKKTGRWTVVPYRVEKKYEFIPPLISRIVERRLEDRIGMSGKAVLSLSDPRRISKTLQPVPPPPTSELVAAKKSRMEK